MLKMSDRDRQALWRIVMKNKKTAAKVASKVDTNLVNGVSTKTLRRELKLAEYT